MLCGGCGNRDKVESQGIDAAMRDIDAALSVKKSELDRLRPISKSACLILARWYDVELTYTSNAIEGNTLTRSETAIVLEKGITIGGKPLADHLEAVGHKDALDYARSVGRDGAALRENDVRQIHALVLGRSEPGKAGRYATVPRMISGSALVLPSPALMGDFGRWLASAPASAETAFAAHERLVTIHPFEDGNGRTARLLMNLVLFRGGYPPVAIGPEHRADYIAGLEACQLDGDAGPYRRFMSGRLEASLDHHLRVMRQGLEPGPADRLEA